MSQDHDDDAARAQTRDLLNEQMAAAVEVLQDLAVNGPTATARLRAQQALRRRSAGAGWPTPRTGVRPLTEDPAVRKYPGVVTPYQMVQRYLMAHHGTATVYLSYRAQGSGRAGLSGVRQVLDVTGVKADDLPVLARRRPEDVLHLLLRMIARRRPPRGRGRPNGASLGGRWHRILPAAARRIYASNSGNDPAGARRGDTSTATPGTARNAPTPAGDARGARAGRTAGACHAAGHRRSSRRRQHRRQRGGGAVRGRPVTRPGSPGTPGLAADVDPTPTRVRADRPAPGHRLPHVLALRADPQMPWLGAAAQPDLAVMQHPRAGRDRPVPEPGADLIRGQRPRTVLAVADRDPPVPIGADRAHPHVTRPGHQQLRVLPHDIGLRKPQRPTLRLTYLTAPSPFR